MEPPRDLKMKKKNKNEGGGEEEDRLSNLPEPILQHILSFLDMKHVVKTSILSTKWRYVWKFLPFLNFDSNLFLQKRNRKMKGFKKFVDNVLNHREESSDIQSFRLSYKEQNEFDVYRWILAAVRGNVQELHLQSDVEYNLGNPIPTCLFTCKSLVKLVLDFEEWVTIVIPDSMSLPQLKTLILRLVDLRGDDDDDDVLNEIVLSCPVLESLTLRMCQLSYNDTINVNISSLQLKHLVVKNCYKDCRFSYWEKYSIKMYAPNLISFYCRDLISTDYSIDNLSGLVRADIDMNFDEYKGIEEDGVQMLEIRKVNARRTMELLRALSNVEALTLSIWSLEVISAARALLETKPTQFCNLRCLNLQTWLSRNCIDAVTYLLKVSPLIESLLLKMKKGTDKRKPESAYCDEVRPNSAEIEVFDEGRVLCPCVLYHLKLVEIRGVQGRLNEVMFLDMLLKNSPVLEKVVLYSSEEQSPHTKSRLMKFTEQLRSLSRASSCVSFLLF